MRFVTWFAWVSLVLNHAVAEEKPTKVKDLIKIELPKEGYTFTQAQAAKGVTFDYKITINKDIDNLIPLAFPPSRAQPAGPSGLYPKEEIRGNKQYYCLSDFGLAPPGKEVVKPVKKGTYKHSFKWDGRNWTGPSDFGNPKGKPFPPGTYEVIITIHGKVVTEKGRVPYRISEKTKLVLK